MEPVFTYRGRKLGHDDIALVRELVAAHPGASRRVLSYRLCEAWGWVQSNGVMSDMLCRGLMLGLHRAGHIELPEVRYRPINNVVARRRPRPVEVDRSPLEGVLSDLGPLEFRQVRRAAEEESLFDGLIEEHHYLGYKRPVGEHLKVSVVAGGRPVACFAWSSSLPRLRLRDRFIGWTPSARASNVRFVAYNTRFLILPWVRVRHLATHLLGRMTRELSGLWQQTYGHPLYLAETYVDRTRFAGTCYRAANWVYLGQTAGRGNHAPTQKETRPRKDLLVLPLDRRFRELLARESEVA